MPLNLDSCITGIFVPGNIGASSGQTPVVRVMPPRLSAVLTVTVTEIASATDLPDQNSVTAGIVEVATATDVSSTAGIFAADITEVATAATAQDGDIAGSVSRSAMLAGVFVNSDGTLREANVDGVMVNL